MGSPPGGPQRTEPPVIVSVTPDSGAVDVRAENVVFEFDAVVSDRPTGQAATLENMFVISPRDGRPRVSWERDRIEVRPRRGFRPNTAYSVTLLPGIADLRGNVTTSSRTIVFSTGPSIPPFAVHGRVFDWMNERVAPNAVLEVIRRPDSLHYVGAADSTGQFSVGPLTEGRYTVRAIIDANSNRALDPTESWDSLSIVVQGTSPFLELLAAPRDTIGPRMLTVTVQDSITLRASFDRPLDPAMPLAPGLFRVVSADSIRLGIARILTRAQLDTAVRADSAARADTAVRPDTVARPDTPARPDTVPSVVVPKPSRPAPVRDVAIRLDSTSRLQPGATYRITAIDVRGLLGAIRTSDRVITVPKARPDSTAPPLPPRP